MSNLLGSNNIVDIIRTTTTIIIIIIIISGTGSGRSSISTNIYSENT